ARLTITWRWPASTLWYVLIPSNGRLVTTGSVNTTRSIGPPSRSALKTRMFAGSVPKKLLPLPHEARETAANASASAPGVAATVCARRVRLMDGKRRNGQIAAGSLYLQSRESTRDRRGARDSATLAGTFETIGYELRKMCSGKREAVRQDGAVQS